MSEQKNERKADLGRVVGFQAWINGREDGYGSVYKLYGKPYLSETACRELGHVEGAGMTYRYLEDVLARFAVAAEKNGLIGNPFPCCPFSEALTRIKELPIVEVEDNIKGDTLMRLYWNDEDAGCGGCISVPIFNGGTV